MSSPPPTSRSLRWLIVLGFVLLTSSAVIAWLAANPPQWLQNKQQNDKTAQGNGGANATAKTRAAAIAFVDVENGTTPLYPVRNGRVVEVYVHEGQEVKKGAPLLKIDDEFPLKQLARAKLALEEAVKNKEKAADLAQQHKAAIRAQEAKVAVRRAEVSEARAGVDKAKRMTEDRLGGTVEDVRIYERATEKAQAGVRAESAELDRLKAMNPQMAIDLAELNIKEKKQQVDEAEYGVRECTLRAPMDGMVLRRFVNPGETLGSNPNRPALQFVSGKWIIRAEVEQEFAGSIKEDMNKLVAVYEDYEAPKKEHRFEGKILRASPWIDVRRSKVFEPLQLNDVRTMEVIIEVNEKAKESLLIGQRVRVKFQNDATQTTKEDAPLTARK